MSDFLFEVLGREEARDVPVTTSPISPRVVETSSFGKRFEPSIATSTTFPRTSLVGETARILGLSSAWANRTKRSDAVAATKNEARVGNRKRRIGGSGGTFARGCYRGQGRGSPG